MTTTGLDRRRVISLAGASLASAIAGCSGGEPTEPAESTAADTTTATTTPKREPTEAVETTQSGQPPTSAVGGEAVTVEMEDTRFVPVRVSVEPGTTVEWVNRDFYEHDVVDITFDDVATDWEFQSRAVREGETVAYTFEEPGVYEYYCSIHGEGAMCGAVLVGDVTLDGQLLCEN